MPTRINPLWFGIAAIALAAAACSKPVAVSPAGSPPAVVLLRVWVKHSPDPEGYAAATRSLAEKIHACTDLEVVEISGFPEAFVEVRVDPRRLEALEVAFLDVVSALEEAVPGGLKKHVRANSKDFTIELVAYQAHFDEDLLIEDVGILTKPRVKTKSGSDVSIRDLASVSVGPGKPQSTHQGVPALYISVKTGGSPARLREIVEQFKSTQPDVRVDWCDEGIKNCPGPASPDPL